MIALFIVMLFIGMEATASNDPGNGLPMIWLSILGLIIQSFLISR